MIRSLWTAKTGMDSKQASIDVISNNLANVNTNGFKKSRAVFQDLLYQTLRQPGAQVDQQSQLPVGLQIGVGSKVVATSRSHVQGSLVQTEKPFDLAINGSGFFQVQLGDGTTAYTRDGGFQVDSQGTMVTASGYMLQPQIQIPANAEQVTIGKDGTVSVKLPGQTATQQVGQLQLANFINPPGLESIGENLYRETAASGAPTTAQPGTNGVGVLNQGFVEGSNVNVTEELINMIEAQRAYEINSKAIRTSDEMLQKLTQL